MSGKINFNNIVCEPIEALYAPLVQQQIINELNNIYSNIEILPIGSVGYKKDDDFNGDIDIAIKCDTIEHLEEIVNTVFGYLNTVKLESYYIVSMAFPYQLDNDPIKYVQCDFILMWDKEYTKFRYRCPNYKNDESKYKVGAKIMFANMILNHCKERYKNLDNNYYAKFDFRPTALYRYLYNLNDKIVKEEYITNDVNEIVNMCFIDGDKNHFNTVETLWEAIHSNIFKYPNEVKEIEKNWFINCWRKGWTSIIPEDFKLEYWTNEEIWKYINKQKIINKINQLFQQGREI